MENGFLVVRDFAGVRNGRASSAMNFGDANRGAMKAAMDHGVEVRVFTKGGEFIVAYVRGPGGRAMVARVGEIKVANGAAVAA